MREVLSETQRRPMWRSLVPCGAWIQTVLRHVSQTTMPLSESRDRGVNMKLILFIFSRPVTSQQSQTACLYRFNTTFVCSLSVTNSLTLLLRSRRRTSTAASFWTLIAALRHAKTPPKPHSETIIRYIRYMIPFSETSSVDGERWNI